MARVALICAAACALGGCGPVAAPPGGARTAPAAPPAPLDPASLAAADLDRGELLSFACQACHTFAAGAAANIGPNLYGIFGERSAQRAGFTYSPALAATDIVWTPAALDRWLADPAGFVAGSTMTFAGYADPDDRRDLIAYLLATLGGDGAVSGGMPLGGDSAGGDPAPAGSAARPAGE